MEPAQTVGDFVRAPLDRYVAGRTWIAFCSASHVSGFLLWGATAADDVEQLLAAVVTEGSPLAAPNPRLIDIRRVGAIDAEVFARFAGHFAAQRDALAHSVTRAAVLHVPGVGAALAAGFSAAAEMPYPVELFTDPVFALEWLGAPEANLIAALDDLHADVVGSPPLLRDLRAHLRTSLRDATLATTAEALAMSTRSLQRALASESSTFQDELQRVRVERACELLAETAFPPSRIAHEIGFSSEQHFGVVFKDATGSTPRRWRVSHRTKNE